MKNITAIVSKRKICGQGMTEYIIIVALIAIAAIGVFTAFGGTIRNQVNAMTMEMSGKDGKTQIAEAVKHADEADKNKETKASKGLGNYSNTASKLK